MHGLNAERVLVASEALGLGYAALRRAGIYATERHVFGRPIGQNQAIQHPLAESWMQLEAARMLTYNAARLYDEGYSAGEYANAAKFLAAEAAFKACERAVLTHGGVGYAKEYHVERYMREVRVLSYKRLYFTDGSLTILSTTRCSFRGSLPSVSR
jgi:alkylation response protein AidB-like acyl-CoA dehydrogenase